MRTRLTALVTALVLLSLVTSCTPAGTTTTRETYWPTEGWRTSTPEEQGMDPARLAQLIDHIKQLGLDVDGVLVVRHGYIVLEEYLDFLNDKDWLHPIYSVTKSITGACVGIALEKGLITGLDREMVEFFPDRTIQNLDERKQRITLEHLLTMTGGMAWNEWQYPYTDPRNAWIQALRSPDTVQYILDLPMADEPGEVWNYNGGFTYLLAEIVTNASGQSILDFATEHLFKPLGIENLNWRKDWNGRYDVAGGLEMTARDLAKFGYLYLHHGRWEDRQVVPADFVAESTRTHNMVSAVTGYGYESWWTHPDDGVYYAAGIYGQRIYVAPELDLVVVFTANIRGPDPEGQMRRWVRDYIMAACND